MIVKLTSEEKRPLVFMTIDILVFVIFHFFFFGLFANNEQQITQDLSIWAAAILSLIPIMIVSRIVLYLLFSITNTLLTGKREEKFLMDELSGIVRLKSNQIFSNVILTGFLISISLLLFGVQVTTMFQGFLLSIYMAFIIKNLAEFYFLRNGTAL